MASAHDEVVALLKLKNNWNSYGGKAVTQEAVDRASELLEPSVVPTGAGGVQLEWHTAGIDLEIEVSPTGLVTVWMSHEEKEQHE